MADSGHLDTVIKVACHTSDDRSKNCHMIAPKKNPMDDMVILHLFQRFQEKRKHYFQSIDRHRAKLVQQFQNKFSQLETILHKKDSFDYVDLVFHRKMKTNMLKQIYDIFQRQNNQVHIPAEGFIYSRDMLRDYQKIPI